MQYSVLNHPDFAVSPAAGVGGSSNGNLINDGVLLMLASHGLRGRSYGDIVADMAATNTNGHNVPDEILTILKGVLLPAQTTHSFDNGRARALQLWSPVSARDAVRAALSDSSHVSVVAQGPLCRVCCVHPLLLAHHDYVPVSTLWSLQTAPYLHSSCRWNRRSLIVTPQQVRLGCWQCYYPHLSQVFPSVTPSQSVAGRT